jgi:hypothetical protein
MASDGRVIPSKARASAARKGSAPFTQVTTAIFGGLPRFAGASAGVR